MINQPGLSTPSRGPQRPRSLAWVTRAVLITCAIGLVPSAVRAQSAENVAVVINTTSPASQKIGEYYVRERGIPAANVIRLHAPAEEVVSRAIYGATIESPIASALARERLQDRVLYIVLTKGVPLRIAGTLGQDGTLASVDSELTLLYRRMTGQAVLARGRVANPYFLGTRETKEARPFTHREHDIFLVSRLDAFTVEDVIALIDRAKSPSTDGRVVLDQRDALVNRSGEEWLENASKRLIAEGHGDRQLLEMTPKPVRGIKPVIGYFSWGSTDPQNRVRSLDLGFAAGSIAASFVSEDARTFEEPPAAWRPTNDNNRATWFAGSSQSLVGDLIREGVTGVAGQISDPYLQSSVRPDVLFSAYLGGFNLIESFYLAIPHLSWQTVVIGDPLCAPFGRKMLPRSGIEAGLDNDTELPALYSKRRLSTAIMSAPGVPEKAVGLIVRAESLVARGDRTRARQALEQAVEIAPDSPATQMQLGLLLETAGEHTAAIARYRRVLALQPKNPIALNNLAYGIAVHEKAPAEALPFARQAVEMAPNEPSILDTLAWVQHLLGNDAEAAKLLAAAVRLAPTNSEIRLHAAIAYAGRGAQAVAETELKEALRLNPELESSDEVKELRRKLAELAK
jgi:uncharacterized protein (TIGR03790 family)